MSIAEHAKDSALIKEASDTPAAATIAVPASGPIMARVLFAAWIQALVPARSRSGMVNIQASGPGVAVGNLWLRFSGGGVLPWWLSVVFGMIAGCDRRAAGAARGSS